MEVQLCSDKQHHKSSILGSHVWCLPAADLRGLFKLKVKNYCPISNIWPSAGESSWILSLFYFSRPEGHLLRTYSHFRVLVLHPFRLSEATHQTRLFSQIASPWNHCVMWIWDVHTRKCPLYIKCHYTALFSVLSLHTTSWRQSSS